ncbi:DUF4832 domain-containing protein [Ferruginibacter sp. HRS2-29]|uniref:DUF4832 domain-containing protein n=1 Tax=Ferruginibacter sp. HRS2-29 TaxID=2487334 RepID=UPI0020CE3337|nr:DUF4832 domain-containing protein [Ferruginibacter sp. HRS2-29]MCP9750196.1 DUF4832 domain-containing protein [Ferruginibacter sp. HRS2-29]
MTKKTLLLLTCLVVTLASAAQLKTIRYEPDDTDFTNPERGFYIPSGTRSSKFVPLDIRQLLQYRKQPQKLGSATYSVNVSLLYRGYELDDFVNKPLSADFLKNLQSDFDVVRKAGLKMILRFAYTNTTHGGDCTDEYKICPPYGDAPREVTFNHISQLKPLLKKNADVIAVLQEGFIGIWGENYFTDHWGDASTSELKIIADSSWAHRNQLLKALLDAMSDSRMVQVRTPQIKQRFVYGVAATVTSAPLNEKTIFTKKDAARVGFHNDCFLASEDDYGTFYDYGNSAGKRDTANKRLRNYFEADSRYVAVGGETCDDAYSPQNDCAPFGIAEQEMASMHYSYLNAAYNNQVNNDWDSLGCMKAIKQKLGYRLVLKKNVFPISVSQGGKLPVQINMANIGFAAPYNPRPVQLVLRNKQNGKTFTLLFNTSVKRWYTGNIRLKQSFSLPKGITAGQYELLLNLPDGYASLQNDPSYSIRLANTDVWEPATGYNKLLHVVEVK